MHKPVATMILASLLASVPAEASHWQDQSIDARPGAFLGARVKLPLGNRTASKPRAELAFAPTQSRIGGNGFVRTRIGNGVALSLAPGEKPAVTLAGLRADRALGFTRGGRINDQQKFGVSTGVWIGVGIVAAAVVVGAILLSDYCDGHIAGVCGDKE